MALEYTGPEGTTSLVLDLLGNGNDPLKLIGGLEKSFGLSDDQVGVLFASMLDSSTLLHNAFAANDEASIDAVLQPFKLNIDRADDTGYQFNYVAFRRDVKKLFDCAFSSPEVFIGTQVGIDPLVKPNFIALCHQVEQATTGTVLSPFDEPTPTSKHRVLARMQEDLRTVLYVDSRNLNHNLPRGLSPEAYAQASHAQTKLHIGAFLDAMTAAVHANNLPVPPVTSEDKERTRNDNQRQLEIARQVKAFVDGGCQPGVSLDFSASCFDPMRSTDAGRRAIQDVSKHFENLGTYLYGSDLSGALPIALPAGVPVKHSGNAKYYDDPQGSGLKFEVTIPQRQATQMEARRILFGVAEAKQISLTQANDQLVEEVKTAYVAANKATIQGDLLKYLTAIGRTVNPPPAHAPVTSAELKAAAAGKKKESAVAQKIQAHLSTPATAATPLQLDPADPALAGVDVNLLNRQIAGMQAYLSGAALLDGQYPTGVNPATPLARLTANDVERDAAKTEAVKLAVALSEELHLNSQAEARDFDTQARDAEVAELKKRIADDAKKAAAKPTTPPAAPGRMTYNADQKAYVAKHKDRIGQDIQAFMGKITEPVQKEIPDVYPSSYAKKAAPLTRSQAEDFKKVDDLQLSVEKQAVKQADQEREILSQVRKHDFSSNRPFVLDTTSSVLVDLSADDVKKIQESVENLGNYLKGGEPVAGHSWPAGVVNPLKKHRVGTSTHEERVAARDAALHDILPAIAEQEELAAKSKELQALKKYEKHLRGNIDTNDINKSVGVSGEAAKAKRVADHIKEADDKIKDNEPKVKAKSWAKRGAGIGLLVGLALAPFTGGASLLFIPGLAIGGAVFGAIKGKNAQHNAKAEKKGLEATLDKLNENIEEKKGKLGYAQHQHHEIDQHWTVKPHKTPDAVEQKGRQTGMSK